MGSTVNIITDNSEDNIQITFNDEYDDDAFDPPLNSTMDPRAAADRLGARWRGVNLADVSMGQFTCDNSGNFDDSGFEPPLNSTDRRAAADRLGGRWRGANLQDSSMRRPCSNSARSFEDSGFEPPLNSTGESRRGADRLGGRWRGVNLQDSSMRQPCPSQALSFNDSSSMSPRRPAADPMGGRWRGANLHDSSMRSRGSYGGSSGYAASQQSYQPGCNMSHVSEAQSALSYYRNRTPPPVPPRPNATYSVRTPGAFSDVSSTDYDAVPNCAPCFPANMGNPELCPETCPVQRGIPYGDPNVTRNSETIDSSYYMPSSSAGYLPPGVPMPQRSPRGSPGQRSMPLQSPCGRCQDSFQQRTF